MVLLNEHKMLTQFNLDFVVNAPLNTYCAPREAANYLIMLEKNPEINYGKKSSLAFLTFNEGTKNLQAEPEIFRKF